MIREFGVFSLYERPLPKDHPWKQAGALFLRNAEGIDWYDIAHHSGETDGLIWCSVKDGQVVSVHRRADALFPEGCLVLLTDQAVEIGTPYEGAFR